jgi:hypothetical protein
MAQETDLYSILVSYANKNNSPYIGIGDFLDYLEKTARKLSKESPSWNKWTQDKAVKFWSEMPLLVEGGKCELLSESENGHVYLSSYYPEKIRMSYTFTDEDAALPFPDEKSLGITLPENQVKYLNSDYDIFSVLAEPKNNTAPVLKIGFPDNFGFALLLPDMFPRQLTEMALLKVRNYLHRYKNKEYIYQKLGAQLQGKEAYLKDLQEQILSKPIDQYIAIEENRELTFVFWTHLCGLIKNEIKKKNEKLLMDIAAFQSVFIIEIVNRYFRSVITKRQEVETAFKNLEDRLAKPPYLYTMDQIMKFTGPGGELLLGQYTSGELSEWIKRQVTGSKNDELPPLLIINIGTKDAQYFLLKEKMILLCARLIHDGQILIKRAIVKQWSRWILDFETDPAMTDDDEFEKLLAKTAEKICPELMSILADPNFLMVYLEMDQKENAIPAAMKIFYNGKLLPYSSVFLIRRRAVLLEAKFVLPFWYSLPFIPGIVGFFTKLFGKKKKDKQPADSSEQVILGEADHDHAGQIRVAAEKLEFDIVPSGYTIDSYLEELTIRWGRLLDKQAREDLVDDVMFLARDLLRRRLKIDKQFKPYREELNQMASNLVIHNAALSSLSGRDSLVLFVELYMVKLLLNVK